MNLCGGLRSLAVRLLDRLLGPPVPPEEAYPDEGSGAEPVRANITYYGDNGVRPHAKRRSAGESDS